MARTKLDPEVQRVVQVLGEALRARRKATGLTQSAVATLARMPQPSVAAIERGRADVSLEELRRLAVAVGTTLVELLASAPRSASATAQDAGDRHGPGRAIRREQLATMDERVLRRHVLLPLFQHMPFEYVAETHGGALEQGKDFILLSKSPTGASLCTGVVAKAGNITGSAESRPGTAATVATQIRQCLRRGWPHPTTHVEMPVNHCWVVASGEIRKEAQLAIQSELDPDLKARVEFIDGDQLYRLIEKHLGPDTALDLLEEAARRMQGAAPRGHHVVAVAGVDGSLGVSLHPRPGVTDPEPILFSATLSQPNTPEGHAALQATLNTIKYGGVLTADDGVLASFTPPAAFAALIPAGESLTPLRLESRPHPRSIPVTILALKDGEPIGAWDHVVLQTVPTGPNSFRATVRDAREALHLVMTQDQAGARFSVGFAPKDDVRWLVDAVRLHGAVEFLSGLSQATTMQIWDDRSAVMISEATGPFGDQGEVIDSSFRELLRLAALVQRFAGRAILMPRRGLPEDQLGDVLRLGALLDGGVDTLPVTNAAITFDGGPDDARAFLTVLTREPAPVITVAHSETYRVLDPPVTVRVQDVLVDAGVSAESRAQLTAWAEHARSGDAADPPLRREIVLRFEPAGAMRVQRSLAPQPGDASHDAHPAHGRRASEPDDYATPG